MDDNAPAPDPNFDRFSQNVTFFLADHNTTVSVPIPVLNAFSDETVRTTMNYGAQLGACIIMLLVVLVLTPSSKLTRASSCLHLAGLFVSIVRMGLLFSYFLSPFSHFYQVWTMDPALVPRYYFDVSLAANTLALPLVIIVQAALMNQAWTMVAFWPRIWKYAACILSAIIVLLTIGTRLAFTIVQNHAIVTSIPPDFFLWGTTWMIVMSAVSIFWFCAIFNVKLVTHLVINRGILPSTTLINPMEVLIMTNGVLMIIPSIFAGLEWAKNTNFESASLTVTSVIIILPLGTLAAQRISSYGSQSYMAGSNFRKQQGQDHSGFGAASRQGILSKPSNATFSSNGTTVTPQISVASRAEMSLIDRPERMDPIDLELSRIDAFRESSEFSHPADRRKNLHRKDFV
ncbi:hypothetical protein NLG97_g727 [Lecanicillium saksenae]|uniref:Uncharacterized protein n=1 Tax=Lecanicillium saksenae TaxID=468837 RepID=A0ACC1R737_9HYPO|nr:hypothetical protein NLG97_g727 [Lecanicillium saksenae]